MTAGERWHHAPFVQLVLARVREFCREPEALFWVYGFPLLMVVALGIAFRERTAEKYSIDLVEGAGAAATQRSLSVDPRLTVYVHDAPTCHTRLRTGKTDLVIEQQDVSGKPAWLLRYDAARPGSLVARAAVDDRLQRAAGRTDPVTVKDQAVVEPGGRYIDFLVPGLLGMSLMGGGLWGVGFVTVDMRIRKLLKRFLATPMRRGHFLASLMVSRMLFMIPEVFVLLLFARIVFGVVIYGSILLMLLLIVVGALLFSGIGLLLASRAKTLEAISGLMNLCMLPMWIMSGIFFSTDRFPEAAQPVIRLLPLTPLIHALRSVALESSGLTAIGSDLAIMVVWSVASFAVALLWFRWE